MEHMQILAYLVSLLVGIWAVILSFQAASSGRHPAFRPISWFLTSFNLLILFGFVLLYSSTNLLSGYEELMSTGIVQIVAPIVKTTFFAMVFALYRVSLALRGKVLSPSFNRRLNLGVTVFIIAYAVFISLLLKGSDHTVAMWIEVATTLSLYLYLIVLMVALYRFGRRRDDEMDRRMITSFGLFYLAGFISLVAVTLLPEEINIIPGVIVIFLFNLFPIYWLRRDFPRQEADAVPVLEDMALIEAFCEQHCISTREREIAELILQGKSNKEIEDQLFISLNTVKNHIYRLYRKIGVNSRSQFIHMLLKEHQNRYRNS